MVCTVEGKLVAGEPADGCQPLQHHEALRGAVVLLQRGRCTFVQKALHSQEAGAIAVVVVNNQPGLMAMGGDGCSVGVGIPAVLVGSGGGQGLLAALPRQVRVRLQASPHAVQRQLQQQLAELDIRQQQQAAAAAAVGQSAARNPDDDSPLNADVAAVDGSAPGGPAEKRASLVELLVPPQAQQWLIDHVYVRKMEINPVFDSLFQLLSQQAHSP